MDTAATATTYVFRGLDPSETAWSLHWALDAIEETYSYAVIYAPMRKKNKTMNLGFAIIELFDAWLAQRAVPKLVQIGYAIQPCHASQGIHAIFDKHATAETDEDWAVFMRLGVRITREAAVMAYGSSAQQQRLSQQRSTFSSDSSSVGGSSSRSSGGHSSCFSRGTVRVRHGQLSQIRARFGVPRGMAVPA